MNSTRLAVRLPVHAITDRSAEDNGTLRGTQEGYLLVLCSFLHVFSVLTAQLSLLFDCTCAAASPLQTIVDHSQQ